MTPLAHMGGIDEALPVLLPLVLVIVLLRMGAKRVPPEEPEEPEEPGPDDEPGQPAS